MGKVYTLTAAGSGNGVYTGTFGGGASGALAGQVFLIAGFTNIHNNGTFTATDSGTTSITTGNTASVSETHAGTATDVTTCIVLDPGGFPQTVVATATATGSAFSSEFCLLDRPTGGVRNLWLQLANAVGSFSAFKVDLLQSFDGGANWQTIQSGIDLYGAPVQMVSPPVSPGAILKLTVSTFTGGTNADVVASSN